MNGQSVSYRLLGLLQEIAPNGVAQQRCSLMYQQAQMNGATEAELQAMLAGVILDGTHYGNWPWVEMPKRWSGVELNREAARTVTEVSCPVCGQDVGNTCLTSSLNEAIFPHAKRLAARRNALRAESTA